MKKLLALLFLCTAMALAQTTIPVGAAIGYRALCSYSDGSVEDCTQIDAHGDAAVWNVSGAALAYTTNGIVVAASPGTGTVGATVGTNQSTLVSVTVVPALTSIAITEGAPTTTTTITGGVTAENTPQGQTNNYPNYTYFITGNASGGYTPTTCSFYLAAGTQTSGAKWDCGLIAAPTPTTEASSWLCHGTYTATSAKEPNATVSVPLTGCGVLPPNKAYWIVVETNDPVHPEQGYYNCGSSCTGAATSTTYPYRYAYAPYGIYTGMPSALATGAATQMSASVTLVTGSSSTAATSGVGSSIPFAATCTYSDGSTAVCTSTVTWVSSSPSVATISSAGIATGITTGTTTISATSNMISSADITITIQ